jgi:hypothetical protein
MKKLPTKAEMDRGLRDYTHEYQCVKCKRIISGYHPRAYRQATGRPITCCGEPMKLKTVLKFHCDVCGRSGLKEPYCTNCNSRYKIKVSNR